MHVLVLEQVCQMPIAEISSTKVGDNLSDLELGVTHSADYTESPIVSCSVDVAVKVITTHHLIVNGMDDAMANMVNYFIRHLHDHL